MGEVTGDCDDPSLFSLLCRIGNPRDICVRIRFR